MIKNVYLSLNCPGLKDCYGKNYMAEKELLENPIAREISRIMDFPNSFFKVLDFDDAVKLLANSFNRKYQQFYSNELINNGEGFRNVIELVTYWKNLEPSVFSYLERKNVAQLIYDPWENEFDYILGSDVQYDGFLVNMLVKSFRISLDNSREESSDKYIQELWAKKLIDNGVKNIVFDIIGSINDIKYTINYIHTNHRAIIEEPQVIESTFVKQRFPRNEDSHIPYVSLRTIEEAYKDLIMSEIFD